MSFNFLNYEVSSETAQNILFLFFVLVVLPISSGIVLFHLMPVYFAA